MRHAARLDEHLHAVGITIVQLELDERRGHRVRGNLAGALDFHRTARSAKLATWAVSIRCEPQSVNRPAGVIADLPPVHGLGAGGGEGMERRRAEPQVPIQIRAGPGPVFPGERPTRPAT